MQLMDISLHTVCHRHPAVVKKELKSPDTKNPSKRKAYSTTGAHPIGRIDVFEGNFYTAPGSSKWQKTGTGASAQVRFDGVVIPNNQHMKATRKSTRTTRATSKKNVNGLFEHLGQEFQAIVKTCGDITEAFN
jgi:hypothetical protein